MFVRDNAIVQVGPTAESARNRGHRRRRPRHDRPARPGQHAPPPVSDADPLHRAGLRAVRLAEDALPHLGPHDAGGRLRVGQDRPGRAVAVGVHHLQRSPLRVPERQPDRRRDPGRGGAGHPLHGHARQHEPGRVEGRPAAGQLRRGRGLHPAPTAAARSSSITSGDASAWCMWRWRRARPSASRAT